MFIVRANYLKKEKEIPQHLIAYLGGDQPSSPEEGKRHFANNRDGYLHWANQQLVLLIRLRIRAH